MHKILLIAKRDYIAVVQTKAFIISLVALPLLCSSAVLPIALSNSKKDVKEKTVAVLDRSGVAAAAVTDSLKKTNERELFDKTTGLQVMPRYKFETIAPSAGDPAVQVLSLSDRIRRGELFALIEIGVNAIEPDKSAKADAAVNSVGWYASEDMMGAGQEWIARAVNDGLRTVRLSKLGLDASHLGDVLVAAPVESMNLLSRDEKTGQISAPRKKGMFEVMVPIVVVMLMLMIVILTSTPMLTAISEDKMQRVFEMLLASATPFQLIAGKVLSAVARSLTTGAVCIGVAIFVLYSLAMIGMAPLYVLPWFLVYLIAEVTMLAAMAAALGAACSTPQDANSFSWFLILPVMIPFFVMFRMQSQPNGPFAIAMSLFPPFTPIAMLLRQVSGVEIPAWQPWAGLVGIALTAAGVSWIAARIFRVGILMQGKAPKVSDLARWAVKG